MKFDRNSPVPLYEQIINELKSEIDNGTLIAGNQLPPEVEMANAYGVSVVTVRSAMNALVKEGLVEKKRGKGTFVTNKKFKRDYTKIQSFSDACYEMGSIPGSKLLEIREIGAGSEIAKLLGIEEGLPVIFISRLRTVNGEPVVIEKNYFCEKFRGLLQENLENSSLFRILKEKYGVIISKSSKEIEIIRTDPEVSNLLNLPNKYPILLVKSIAFDQYNNPVYVGAQTINGERFTLKV